MGFPFFRFSLPTHRLLFVLMIRLIHSSNINIPYSFWTTFFLFSLWIMSWSILECDFKCTLSAKCRQIRVYVLCWWGVGRFSSLSLWGCSFCENASKMSTICSCFCELKPPTLSYAVQWKVDLMWLIILRVAHIRPNTENTDEDDNHCTHLSKSWRDFLLIASHRYTLFFKWEAWFFHDIL